MQALDTTILNTAVPVVAKALNVAPLSMRSVLASYALALGVFIPISGWMADRFGTRNVFTLAIGLFTAGSVLCGFCSDIHLLVACRILQGCGGAMMVPVGRLTLVRTFAKSELVRAMSFVAVPALIGPMLGPIAGGLIVAYLNWRFVFFVNLADRTHRADSRLFQSARLSRTRDETARRRRLHPLRIRRRAAVICARSLRRSLARDDRHHLALGAFAAA